MSEEVGGGGSAAPRSKAKGNSKNSRGSKAKGSSSSSSSAPWFRITGAKIVTSWTYDQENENCAICRNGLDGLPTSCQFLGRYV